MLWVYLYCLAIVFANVLAKSTSCLFYQHFLSGPPFIQRLFYPAPFLSSAFLSGAFLNRMPFKTALSQKTRNQRTFQHSNNLSRAIVHPTPIYFRRFNPNLIPLCTSAAMGQNPILRPSRSYQQPRGDILTMYPLTNRSIYQRIFLTTYVLTDALAGR